MLNCVVREASRRTYDNDKRLGHINVEVRIECRT